MEEPLKAVASLMSGYTGDPCFVIGTSRAMSLSGSHFSLSLIEFVL